MITVEDQEPIIDEITIAFVKNLSKREEVAIIIMYGSRSPKKASASPSSDVEYIAICDDPEDPEDRENHKKVKIEFTYKGIPTDIWSISW